MALSQKESQRLLELCGTLDKCTRDLHDALHRGDPDAAKTVADSMRPVFAEIDRIRATAHQ